MMLDPLRFFNLNINSHLHSNQTENYIPLNAFWNINIFFSLKISPLISALRIFLYFIPIPVRASIVRDQKRKRLIKIDLIIKSTSPSKSS